MFIKAKHMHKFYRPFIVNDDVAKWAKYSQADVKQQTDKQTKTHFLLYSKKKKHFSVYWIWLARNSLKLAYLYTFNKNIRQPIQYSTNEEKNNKCLF